MSDHLTSCDGRLSGVGNHLSMGRYSTSYLCEALFSPHCVHRVQRCSLWQVTGVPWFMHVSVYLLDVTMSRAKTAKPIKLVNSTRWCSEPCIGWGPVYPAERGQFLGSGTPFPVLWPFIF